MTVWHLSASLRMHLAHLASPAMLISLPAALSAASVEVAPANMAKPATVRTNRFLFIVLTSGYRGLDLALASSVQRKFRLPRLSDFDWFVQPVGSGRTPPWYERFTCAK